MNWLEMASKLKEMNKDIQEVYDVRPNGTEEGLCKLKIVTRAAKPSFIQRTYVGYGNSHINALRQAIKNYVIDKRGE